MDDLLIDESKTADGAIPCPSEMVAEAQDREALIASQEERLQAIDAKGRAEGETSTDGDQVKFPGQSESGYDGPDGTASSNPNPEISAEDAQVLAGIADERRRRKAESQRLYGVAEGAAEAVLGNPVGVPLIAADVAKEMLVSGTRSLLDLLEKLGSTAQEYIYTPEADDSELLDDDEFQGLAIDEDEDVDGTEHIGDAQTAKRPVPRVHVLIDLFSLRKGQRKAIMKIFKAALEHVKEQDKQENIVQTLAGSTIATKIVNGTIDVFRFLRAIEETDGDSKLFAHLYVPEGKAYSAKRAANLEYIERFDHMEFGQQVGAVYRFFSSSVSWSPDAIQTLLKKLIFRDTTA